MYRLTTTKNYRKRFTKLLKSGSFDDSKLSFAVQCLLSRRSMPEGYRDHGLNGKLAGYRDCHVANDIVLIYKIDITKGLLTLYNIGSHSDLFG